MVQREGVRMSIFADGGSGGRLADGRKVIVITCLPSGSEDPLLLKVQVLDAHETGVVQAQIIKDVAAEYGINPSSIKYLCADNAAVNSKTVDLLREEAAWAHLEYVRCLPHCLQLLIDGIDRFGETSDFRFDLFFRHQIMFDVPCRRPEQVRAANRNATRYRNAMQSEGSHQIINSKFIEAHCFANEFE